MNHVLYLSVIMIIAVSIQIPESLCVNDAQFSNCSASYKCGSKEITYPFYGASNRPEYCGYPGFKAACVNESILMVNISSLTYRVLAMDYSSETLTVARDDYWENYCPKYLYNTTIDFNLFSYGLNYQNLSLYYNCLANVMVTTQFTCTTNQTSDTAFATGYYFTSVAEYSLSRVVVGCNDLVLVPVSNIGANTLITSPSVSNLQTVVKEGFELVWKANNSRCDVCARSGGQCGHAVGSGDFVCYCSDKPYGSECGSSRTTGYGSSSTPVTPISEKKSSKLVLILGILLGGGAAIACIALALLFFGIRQRKKKLLAESKSKGLSTPSSSNGVPTPTKKFSRTTASHPSSLSTDLEKGSSYFGVQVFTYEELEKATDNFHSSRQLGDGGFGVVYKGNLHDGRVVAVKRLYENNCKRVHQFINEVEILARLRHPNLVSLYGCTSRRSQELLLVYEYIPNGTIADHLHGNRVNSGLLTWPVRLRIAVESACALTYLHKSDIIHRDVKTNNILLDNDFGVKVADFGLSRLFPTDVTHVSTAPQGTPGYVDPEYYQCYQLTAKSDVYSFGVVLVELITSLPAVDINRHRHDINLSNMAITKIQNHMLHELVDPSLGFESDFSVRRTTTLVAELAFRCLQQDRDMRPSMEEVVECLRVIEMDQMKKAKPEVVDIDSDDVGLLKSMSPPSSPDSDKWAANLVGGANSY